MNIESIITKSTRILKEAEVEAARTDAELIVAHVLGRNRAWLLAHNNDSLTSKHIEQVTQLAQMRANRQPLSYVLGHREFAGLTFKIDNRVLTPRIETEMIVIEVTKRAQPNASILDVGTGSGAMAIALKHLRPDLQVMASEVSSEALDLARENSQTLLAEPDDVTFVQSDLLSNITDKFDIVVANLPYVTRQMELLPEVIAEPDIALFGGSDDGLDLYRKFFTQLPKHLSPKAQLWLESDPWQQPELIKLAAAIDLTVIFQDYFILGFETS
ncbi:MAG: peptide chain release factor N(5)-glutamine methyltransferase [bacterium]